MPHFPYDRTNHHALPAPQISTYFSDLTIGVVQMHLEVFEQFPVRFTLRTFLLIRQLGSSPKGMERVFRSQQY